MADHRKHWILGGLVVVVAGGLVAAGTSALKAKDDKKPLAEVMKRMQYYNQALGVDCTYCHVGIEPAKARIETPRKRTARWMQENLVDALVTRDAQKPIDCHTCHNGQAQFLPSSQ